MVTENQIYQIETQETIGEFTVRRISIWELEVIQSGTMIFKGEDFEVADFINLRNEKKHPLIGQLVTVVRDLDFYKKNRYDHYLYTVEDVYQYYSVWTVQLAIHSLLPDKQGNHYRDLDMQKKKRINMLISDVIPIKSRYVSTTLLNKFMNNY